MIAGEEVVLQELMLRGILKPWSMMAGYETSHAVWSSTGLTSLHKSPRWSQVSHMPCGWCPRKPSPVWKEVLMSSLCGEMPHKFGYCHRDHRQVLPGTGCLFACDVSVDSGRNMLWLGQEETPLCSPYNFQIMTPPQFCNWCVWITLKCAILSTLHLCSIKRKNSLCKSDLRMLIPLLESEGFMHLS